MQGAPQPDGETPSGQAQGLAQPSPFIVQQQPTIVVQQQPIVVQQQPTTHGGQPLLPTPAGGSGVYAPPAAPSLLAAQAQAFLSSGSLVGSGGSGFSGGGLSADALSLQGSLWDQLSARASTVSSAGGLGLAGSGGSLPSGLLPTLLQPAAGYPPLAAAAAQQQQQAAKAPGRKPRPRTYKPPDVQAAEKKQAAEVKEQCRQLEQQLGRARAELQKLQQENKALQRKAVALSKHSSFRRAAAAMAEGLSLITRLPSSDWGQGGAQAALAAAERGLPPPEAIEQLRCMALPEAVAHYNRTVARARELLQQADHGPDPAEGQAALADLLALSGGGGGAFGYLQVVSPEVFAQLTQAKLDPGSPVDREDGAHWRGVLAAMRLSEEQEAQLILLLQSHLAQAEHLAQRKSRVMQTLAEELSNDLLSLELRGSLGSGELSSALSPVDLDGAAAASAASSSSGQAAGGGASPAAPMPARDELQQLIRLEYWLRFDFAGAVRKLLPPQQQALCMVASWPYYPDQRQLAEALREKAGQLWDQLRRASA